MIYEYHFDLAIYSLHLSAKAMSSSLQTFHSRAEQEVEEAETNPELYQHFANHVASLPSSKGLAHVQLHRHDHGWFSNPLAIVGSMVADASFSSRSSDIIVASHPKCGTTWTKALLYAVVHRREQPVDAADHPFNSMGPHECVSFFELWLYTNNRIPNLDHLPDPRLFASHVPFMSLPRTVASSGSKIVYVCRDPKDAFVSLLAFVNEFRVRDGMDPLSVEVAVEFFCDGAYMFGPYWDHVLGYWRAYLAHPEKVLFFRYEEMQKDPAAHVRRLAEFAGCPFDDGEEGGAAVEAIVRFCSFQHLSELDVNKGGAVDSIDGRVQNSSFFRRGVVGDWRNRLTPETARRIDAITEAKFMGSGLII